MLSLLQPLPGTVDVRDHLAFCWGVGLLVVSPHLALDGEQQDLQVALFYKPTNKK